MKVSIGLKITDEARAKINAAIDELSDKMGAIIAECATTNFDGVELSSEEDRHIDSLSETDLTPHDAYKFLRQNGMKVMVGLGRLEEGNVSVTAFTKTDENGAHAGVVVKAEAETVDEAIISAAQKVNRVARTLSSFAEAAGEKDFADFVHL
jgi:hypothetical protein